MISTLLPGLAPKVIEKTLRVTAERLTRYLQQSGYILMRRAPPAAPSTSGHKHPHEG